jgi:hypothetical protein
VRWMCDAVKGVDRCGGDDDTMRWTKVRRSIYNKKTQSSKEYSHGQK